MSKTPRVPSADFCRQHWSLHELLKVCARESCMPEVPGKTCHHLWCHTSGQKPRHLAEMATRLATTTWVESLPLASTCDAI